MKVKTTYRVCVGVEKINRYAIAPDKPVALWLEQPSWTSQEFDTLLEATDFIEHIKKET